MMNSGKIKELASLGLMAALLISAQGAFAQVEVRPDIEDGIDVKGDVDARTREAVDTAPASKATAGEVNAWKASAAPGDVTRSDAPADPVNKLIPPVAADAKAPTTCAPMSQKEYAAKLAAKTGISEDEITLDLKNNTLGIPKCGELAEDGNPVAPGPLGFVKVEPAINAIKIATGARLDCGINISGADREACLVKEEVAVLGVDAETARKKLPGLDTDCKGLYPMTMNTSSGASAAQ